jgi:hypothetical protein
MKKKNKFIFAAGVSALFFGVISSAGAGDKTEHLHLAAIEKTPALTPQVLYEKPAAALGEKEKRDREMIAMGRRIEEEAVAGAPVQINLGTGIELPKSCMPGEACPLTLVVQNKGNIPVTSPILAAVTLGASGGVSATTKTTGWTCGFADPNLTCASTGVVLQAGEKSSFVIDWMPPQVKAKQNAKICFNLVWAGRPKDGVYRADQIAAVQFALVRAGFETGGIDGRIRPKTLQAIRLLRQVVNIPGPPQITPDLLQNLFGEAGKLSSDADSSDDQACGLIDLVPSDKKSETKVIASAPSGQDAKKTGVIKNQEMAQVTPPPSPTSPPAPKIEEKKEAPKAVETAPVPKVESKPAPSSSAPINVPAAPVAPVAPKAEVKPVPVAPIAPKAEEKKEMPKTAQPAPSTQKAEEKKEAPKAMEPAPKAETKAQAHPAPSTPSQPAPKAAIKNETKSATPVQPTAPAQKSNTKKAPEAAISEKPQEKISDRLASSPIAPKNKTIIRSTLSPESYPIIVMPEEAAKEAAQSRGYPTASSSSDRDLVIISTSREEDVIYHRSAEEKGLPIYYIVDRGEGKPAPKTSAPQECVCKPVASKPKAEKPEAKMPHKKHKGASVHRKHAYIPTGSEIVAGWPYKN